MRSTNCLLLAIVSVAIICAPAVHAKRTKVPSANLFSSPDVTDKDAMPTFVNNGGKPITDGRPERVPDFNVIRMIPDLSKDQLKKFDDMRKSLDQANNPLRDQINALNERLDKNKPTPDATINVDGLDFKKNDLFRALIADLRKQIENRNNDRYKAAINLLTADQKDELDRIRHGELITSQMNK